MAVFWGAQFLPWLIVSRPVFFFYMVPVVPFLALGLAYAVAVLDEQRPWLGAISGGALGAAVGFAAGLGFEAAVDATTTTARWMVLGIGWLVGAGIGAWTDRHRVVRRRFTRVPRGAVGGAIVGIAAVGLLVYFLPVWVGLPLPSAIVRQRWWFNGWI